MKLFFLFSTIFLASSLFAQDSSLLKMPESSSVIVHKDPRLDSLVKKQSEINETIFRNSRWTVKGFRILIINTNKRNDATEAKAKMYTYFPELPAYLTYKSPYFRLKVGNFREREDAEAYQKKINKYFPDGVFVVNDIIEVKPGDPSVINNSDNN